MIPLNEYPKGELKSLLLDLEFTTHYTTEAGLDGCTRKWILRVKEAISDQDFKEKELPFKTEDNESREFEL